MNPELESNELPLELVLHTGLGIVFAVALAVMVVWPQVQTLTV